MSEALDLLKKARAAIIAFRPDESTQILIEFENKYATSLIPKDEVALVISELRQLRDLSEAACDGVAAARAQIREIDRIAGTLETYDRHGSRHAEQSAQSFTKKF